MDGLGALTHQGDHPHRRLVAGLLADLLGDCELFECSPQKDGRVAVRCVIEETSASRVHRV
jgi:hypothetical protein